jgi:hypothetical protein
MLIVALQRSVVDWRTTGWVRCDHGSTSAREPGIPDPEIRVWNLRRAPLLIAGAEAMISQESNELWRRRPMIDRPPINLAVNPPTGPSGSDALITARWRQLRRPSRPRPRSCSMIRSRNSPAAPTSVPICSSTRCRRTLCATPSFCRSAQRESFAAAFPKTRSPVEFR